MPPENNAQELRSHCSVLELRADESLAYFAVNIEKHPTHPYVPTTTAILPDPINPKLLRNAAACLRLLARELDQRADDHEFHRDPS